MVSLSETTPKGNKTCMASDDDDEVAFECDVLLSRPVQNDEVHVFQYPLRHAKVGVGKDRRVTGVNIRPQYGRVEVQLSVFPDDPATSAADGDQMELAQPCTRSFDGSQMGAEEKNIGRTQKLRSRSHLQSPTCNYAVASIVESKEKNLQFVIVPVHSVSQLRPAFDYLDEYDEAVLKQRVQKSNIRSAIESGISPKTEIELQKDKDVAPLQVSFKRRESERAAERRRNSHATLREREEGEAWITLDYHNHISTESDKRMQQIFNNEKASIEPKEENEDELIVDTKEDSHTDYKDLFVVHTKGARTEPVSKGTINPQETSQRSLKLLATNAAVIQVVAYARIVHFSEICSLTGDRPIKEVLAAGRVAAYCLRGCWVAKKGLREMRRLQTVAERYDACRILILSLFRTNRAITSKMAEDCIGEPLLITEKAISSILSEVAVEPTRGKGWFFKLEDDHQFKAAHPEIVKKQDAEWDNRIASAREAVSKLQRQIQSKRRQTM